MNLDHNRNWTELLEKNCVIFVVKKLYFVNFLDLICTLTFNFQKFWILDELGMSFENSGLDRDLKI